MALEVTPPADSLKDDGPRFMAHVVAIGVVVTMFLVLTAAVTLMCVRYWG